MNTHYIERICCECGFPPIEGPFGTIYGKTIYRGWRTCIGLGDRQCCCRRWNEQIFY